MIKRMLFVVALLTAVVLPGTRPQPALAGTYTGDGVALAQVKALLADFNGSTFDLPNSNPNCARINMGGDGQCWWWAANAWMALITWADEHPSDTTYRPQIKTDLHDTFNYLCYKSNYSKDYPSLTVSWADCPASEGQSGTDPFTINQKGATYFDDIGWWETMWLSAYKLDKQPGYLYLAEELWNYVTNNGYHWDYKALNGQLLNISHDSGDGCGGVVQYHNPNYAGTSKTVVGPEDTFANALYVEDSARLFTETGDLKYLDGTNTLNWTSGYVGGARYADNWIKGLLIFNYNNITPGTTGARFMMAGQTDQDQEGRCYGKGNRTFLHAQGAMVNAWTDMSKACSTSGNDCSSQPIYFDHLAEELANSVFSDKLDGSTGTWPFENEPVGPQAAPTVDTNGVLSEMCDSTNWPRGCDLGTDLGSYQPYLIAKGIFERAVYCVESNSITDTNLEKDVETNATSIINRLINDGFLWDSSDANAPVNFATQASILEAENAYIGQQEANASTPDPHYGMC